MKSKNKYDSEHLIKNINKKIFTKRNICCLINPLHIFLESIILLLIFTIIYNVKFIYDRTIHVNNKNKNKNIYFDLNNKTAEVINSKNQAQFDGFKFFSIKKEELIPYLNYIELSEKEILLEKQHFKQPKEPNVSVIISLHNREDYIKQALRSIQNQNLTNIEIIIVDDFSTDNSTKYVRQYQKKDPRIILLQNKENMGTLYSKSIGVLYAKGQYINSLDSDDMFCNKYYLSSAFDMAIQGNYDFVASKALYIDELQKTINYKYSFWVVLWNKLIKKEVYQNSIYKVGKDILQLKIITLDDDVIALFLFLGKKGINLPITGVAHFIHSSEHVFFNRFNNKKNSEIFCRKMVATITGFYFMKHSQAKFYGKFLLKSHFVSGPCKPFSEWKEVKKLMIDYEV